MKLLITPALKMTPEYKAFLEKEHELFFADSEKYCLDNAMLFTPNDIEGVICNYFFMNNNIDSFPRLKFIQLTSVGLDRLSLEAVQKRDISLYNIRNAYVVPMAEFALFRTLEIYKRARFFEKNNHNHIWEKCREIEELYGKSALIVGFGNVGREIAKRLRGFGVNIIGVSRTLKTDPLCDEMISFSELEQVIERVDIVYICLPLTTETCHLFDQTLIEKMKTESVLINIARGAIIDENALKNALKLGKFKGIALDVFENEPLGLDDELWENELVYISPHNSFVGEGNRERIFEEIMNNIDDYRRGGHSSVFKRS